MLWMNSFLLETLRLDFCMFWVFCCCDVWSASKVDRLNRLPFQEKRLSNKINYEILKEIEDSESSALKPFYPTRTEIISCLGGGTPGGENTLKREQSPEYSCSSSPRLPISQSNTAVFSDNKVDHFVRLVLPLLFSPSAKTYSLFRYCAYNCDLFIVNKTVMSCSSSVFFKGLCCGGYKTSGRDGTYICLNMEFSYYPFTSKMPPWCSVIFLFPLAFLEWSYSNFMCRSFDVQILMRI